MAASVFPPDDIATIVPPSLALTKQLLILRSILKRRVDVPVKATWQTPPFLHLELGRTLIHQS